jgi:hypothetical protein
MERTERIGLIVSGSGHLALLLWALLGGIFFRHDQEPQMQTTAVSLMSSTDFAALQAAAPKAVTESPPAPSAPPPAEAAPAPQPDTPPDTVEPAPEPAPVGTTVTDTPPTPQAPPVEEPSPTIQPDVSPRPKPKPAPRVAPTPTDAPATDAQVSDTAVAETTPTPSDTPTPDQPKTAEAPPEAGDVLLTEANKDQKDSSSSAPLTSGRPKARPKKLPAAEAPAATQTASADTNATDTAVNDAVAEALSGAASDTPAPGTGTAASGPPLTGGEKDGMLHAVSQCWNLGSASSEVLNTIVTVQFDLDQDAKPISGTIKLAGSSGGSNDSASRGFEIARRAILRCGAKGFPLPADKYETWRQMEISFDPSQMRLR